MRKIELLAPARDAVTAREAILHGADAVYIGAPRFGARAAAGNSLEDLRELVTFAHIYRVKVYVTLNTILYDEELEDARQLIVQLYEMGVDALIVQDMALLEMNLPPIALHASTQMDNRTADKVKWLHTLGFEQTVLARELTLDEIRQVHEEVPEMQLEVFVHGSTCVSYNGQCYVSQYCFGRSANRGECAQFCRMPFDLIDEEGELVRHARTGEVMRQRHLLSLRDMNRSEDLEALMDAGVTSFKIEGRLKDVAYVKNVVAYYRQRIDAVLQRRFTDYCRSSEGHSQVEFTPDVERTFNRGFSNYFLYGRTHDMVQLSSPKSIGQPVGHVKEVRHNSFTVSTVVPFANGDGICFVDSQGNLQGCRINRVEGNRLFPKEMPTGLKPRMPLYRNYDQAFLQQLSHPTAQRRIGVHWRIENVGNTTVHISLCSADGVEVEERFEAALSPARSAQHEPITRQFSRLGDTPFQCEEVDISFTEEWFLPSSVWADWRRQLVEALIEKRKQVHAPLPSAACTASQPTRPAPPSTHPTSQSTRLASPSTPLASPLVRSTVRPASSTSPGTSWVKGLHLAYNSNVSNRLARAFYERQGAASVAPAMERGGAGDVLMTLRYCPKYELGLCGKPTGKLSLRAADGRVFPLHVDCKQCQVRVMVPEKG